MKRQSLIVAFVLGALLLSAWGNVIAAGFCPRSALQRDCCSQPINRPASQVKHESCHHEMAGMEMTGMEMGDPQMEARADSAADTSSQNADVTPESSVDENAVGHPIEACNHCMSHSQTTSGNVSVLALDPSKGLVKTDSLPPSNAIDWTRAFTEVIAPSEHGPPTPSSPRHVIINVFRI